MEKATATIGGIGALFCIIGGILGLIAPIWIMIFLMISFVGLYFMDD